MLRKLHIKPRRFEGGEYFAPVTLQFNPLKPILLLFFFSLLTFDTSAQCGCATGSASLDWNVLNWPLGSFNNNYDLQVTNSEVLNVEIDISTTANGSFTNQFGYDWPQKDSVGGDPEFFGSNTDLALIFDPDANQGNSPIIIKVIFDQTVECVDFEISDIDISGTTRRDSVVVTSNAGNPTLTTLGTQPTVAVSGNVAAATGTGGTAGDGTSSKDDNGSINVDFGDLGVDTIYITYLENSGLNDPTGRGIGFLGSFFVCPPPVPGSISGTVLEDIDNNDTGDNPIPVSTTIHLLDENGDPVLDDLGVAITTTTAVDGTYSFTNVAPGDYQVEEEDPTGYVSVSDTDSGDPSNTSVTVGAAEDVTGVDFIDEQAASISGTVLEDTNNDGTGDAPMPAGVVINLLDDNGDPVLDDQGVAISTSTAIDGTYSFTNIPPADYQVEEVDPVGYNSVSDTDNGDANNTSVSLDPGEVLTGIDFVDEQLGSISGTVYEDTDGNGTGDVVITSGVVIHLLDENGNPVLDDMGDPITATTAVDGTYTFNDLPTGNYQVEEEDPAEYSSVGDTDGGNENNTSVSLAAGEDKTGIDFIDELSGRIRGTVLEDTNGDGNGDVAVPTGTILQLLYTNGNPVLDDNGDPTTTTTSPTGSYIFRDVPPGDYQVEEIDPIGLGSVSDTDGGDPNNTSVTLSAGQMVSNIDFVDEEAYNISGNVYQDADGLTDNLVDGQGINTLDGQQQMITLYTDVFVFVASANVASDGSFEFLDVTPGDYIVQLNDPGASPSLPGTWVNTGENLGAGTGNDGTVDGTQAITISNADITMINYGVEEPPVANTINEPTQQNPGGNNQVQVPTLGGSDLEDGTYGAGSTMIIDQVPTNAMLYYNGTLLINGSTINNYDPTLLTLDPNDGEITVIIGYRTIDAAAEMSPVATVTMPFSTVLPVELLSFDARKLYNWTQLSWFTANELNNERFEVERSEDGVDFELIGAVRGQGFSDHIQEYSYQDRRPNPGINYYRLKQVDTDGTFTYSETKAVDFGSQTQLKVFPNPTTGMVYYEVDAVLDKIQVVDLSGKVILLIDQPAGEVNMQGMTEGLYFLRFYMKNGSVEVKKMKVINER